MKLRHAGGLVQPSRPAAFRRLCVETTVTTMICRCLCTQPPSGGCVLKPAYYTASAPDRRQPPSGGCVLKPMLCRYLTGFRHQPPSGGCVLKQTNAERAHCRGKPAAFRRLCVETLDNCRAFPVEAYQPPSGGCVLKLLAVNHNTIGVSQPPSGGCVLKQPHNRASPQLPRQPPSGGCVLKHKKNLKKKSGLAPAAFRRLCVET